MVIIVQLFFIRQQGINSGIYSGIVSKLQVDSAVRAVRAVMRLIKSDANEQRFAIALSIKQ